jgi:hypothetical protein
MRQLAMHRWGREVPELSFTKLEIEALARIEALFSDEVPGLAAQLANARPVSRENTGAGFFTDISVDQSAVAPIAAAPSPLDGPEVRVGKMSGTLGLLLFIKHGYVSLLEGYSTAAESTALTDLVNEPFEFLDTLSDGHATVQVLRKVPGGDRVLAWFGAYPEFRGHVQFGDFEVIAVCMRRGGMSTIEIALDGFPTFIFHFDDWLDVNVEGFGQQNVLGGLLLRWAQPRDVRVWELGLGYEHPTVEMVLEPCYGANGTISGRLLRIDMIEALPR